MKSSYTVVYENESAIFIVDDNLGGLSVTNDAERVVKELLTSKGQKRIVYRDSDGRWDELGHDGVAFVRFLMLSSTDPLFASNHVEDNI